MTRKRSGRAESRETVAARDYAQRRKWADSVTEFYDRCSDDQKVLLWEFTRSLLRDRRLLFGGEEILGSLQRSVNAPAD